MAIFRLCLLYLIKLKRSKDAPNIKIVINTFFDQAEYRARIEIIVLSFLSRSYFSDDKNSDND